MTYLAELPDVTGPLDLRLNRAGSWLNVCRFDARHLGHVHRAVLTLAEAAEGRISFRIDTLGGAAVLHIAELSGPRPLAAEGSRSNDVLAGTPGGKD